MAFSRFVAGQMLNLTHDWLRSFLPHVLTKIDRVSFGLLTPQDLERALKVFCIVRLFTCRGVNRFIIELV